MTRRNQILLEVAYQKVERRYLFRGEPFPSKTVFRFTWHPLSSGNGP